MRFHLCPTLALAGRKDRSKSLHRPTLPTISSISTTLLPRWSGLAAAAGGVLLITYGVLCWVNDARLYGEVNAIGGVKQGPQWALGIMQEVGYLLFIGGLASLVGLLEHARRARPKQA